jgi:hypothetical protein
MIAPKFSGYLAVPSRLKSHTCSRLFPFAYRLKPLACFREFDLDRVLGGRRGQHTQKDPCLGLSSEVTFPLVVRGRRAVDRLTKPRDWSIGSSTLGHPFGPNLVSFRGREARPKQDLLKRVGIEIKTHLESTRKQDLQSEKTPWYCLRLTTKTNLPHPPRCTLRGLPAWLCLR